MQKKKIFLYNEKNCRKSSSHISYKLCSHRAGNLSRTQAACAYINRLRSAVYNSLYLTDIRLPRSVRASVRVADLNTESNTLAADFALCHYLTPPMQLKPSKHIYFTTKQNKMQAFFYKKLKKRNIF